MTFSQCVVHALNELEKAKKRVPPNMEELMNYESDFPLHILEIEFGEEKPLSERLGVSRGLFPPEVELDDDEVEAVVDKIIEVWAVFHYIADLPEGLPTRIAYTTLLSVWDEPVMLFTTGHFHFDFYQLELDRFVDKNSDQEKEE
jgi:hypothetical protein